MNQFVEFINEYWYQLLLIVAAVVEIIFIFVKRKPKSVDDFKLALSEALSCIPELVSVHERPGEGVLKRTEVEISCLKHIEKVLSRCLTDKEIDLVKTAVDEKIEVVLSSPKKKENDNEK